MAIFLYTLELEGGRWYVGTTKRPRARLCEHRNGTGAEWTRQFPPLAGFSELRKLECAAHEARLHEDSRVKALMLQQGIDAVRGGSYSRPHLTREETRAVCRELFHAANGCIRCGRSNHWASACHAATDVVGNVIDEAPELVHPSSSGAGRGRGASGCSRCGRENHTRSECYAATHVDGSYLDDMQVDEGEDDSGEEDDSCFRCGRSGHWASQCYARTDVHGDRLHRAV